MVLTAPVPLSVRRLNRNILIGGSVVLFHAAALWVLQTGLLRRAVEVIVPVEILSEIVTPQPEVRPAAPTPKPPEPVKPVTRKLERAPPPAPKPLAIADPRPAPNAPTGVLTPPPAPATAAPVSPEPAPAPPAPPRVEPPTIDASYLQNPPPTYPPISRRLGEQGKIVVRVLIGADGIPQRAEIKRSSGFERLDRAAVEYVMRCRYSPGKVGGVPQAMAYDAPVNFVLE